MQVEGHGVYARSLHSASAITHTPGLVEVVVFGGYTEYPRNYTSDADLPPTSNTAVLLFGESTKSRTSRSRIQ